MLPPSRRLPVTTCHAASRAIELRLAAARALGNLHETGLAIPAEKLAARNEQPAFLGRLLAASLLVRHTDATVVELMTRLAHDQEPAVALAAIQRLRSIGLPLAAPFAESSRRSPDAALRRLGAELLVESATVEAVRQLGSMLNDRNPGVRRYVAGKLAEFGARPELREEVLAQVSKTLATDDWRGQEQAILVAGTLDFESTAPRIMELLERPRSEVAVTAAWGLRKLRISDTLPELLRRATKFHEQVSGMPNPPHIALQQSQLFQLFGEARFRESEPLMRLYVPQSTMDRNARAAACWALGNFYENVPESDLAALFAQRFADVPPPPPGETMLVRQMAAIGLGRMKSAAQLPVLREFTARDGPSSATGMAGGWAIEQITGEKPAAATNPETGVSGWFLNPID